MYSSVIRIENINLTLNIFLIKLHEVRFKLIFIYETAINDFRQHIYKLLCEINTSHRIEIELL
jgi:hypothetical protein